MRATLIFTIVIVFIGLVSCSNENNRSDAYGNFESTEVIISSEGNGKILSLTVNEGDKLSQNQVFGLIDTVQLYLKKEQILASMKALHAKTQDIQVQMDVLNEQKKNVMREKNRVESLYKDSAATRKQFDDINGEMLALDKQILATKKTLETGNNGLLSELKPLEAQLQQIEDQISKSVIKSPINGTVLTKYSEQGEIASYGKPMIKIADLENMYLRVYVSGTQLPNIKIGQTAEILIDKNRKEMSKLTGKVEWISDKAEFTPKIIQTKEERVNLVYAVKILVKNDGSLKIGMPGEVNFK
jgi:HlyD family secretion protein